MTFTQAISACLSKYTDWSGRARRSEYWWFALFGLLVGIVANVLDAALGTGPAVNLLVNLGLFLPSLAVTVRRLHDTDRSGWWLFIVLVPLVGFFVLLYFLLQDSRRPPNRYGPSPKDPGYGYAAGGYGEPGAYGQPGGYSPPGGFAQPDGGQPGAYGPPPGQPPFSPPQQQPPYGQP